MLRFVGSLMALALVVTTGCKGSGEAGDGAPAAGASVQARGLPEIWADVLKQRDLIQLSIAKGHEMWHEDCAAVSSGAGALDKLAIEMASRVRQMPSVDSRRRGIDNLMGYLQASITQIRSDAIEEKVGAMPGLLIGLDAILRSVENQFTPEEIGSDSVATHPAFNPNRPPPPPSPV